MVGTPTSYPMESEMSNYNRAVYLQIAGGTIYYLSPGGSVTISGNKDTIFDKSDGNGDFIVISNPTADSMVIRVDSQIQLIGKADDSESDGISTPPQFDIFEFVGDVMQNVTNKTAYLTWRAKTFSGFVKNFTITQRAGEGNLVDLSFTFLVGKPIVDDDDGFWDSFWG